MSVSSRVSNTSGGTAPDKKPREYRYDLKLEVSVKPEAGTVQIADIFRELVKRMKSAVEEGKPLVFLTALDQIFYEEKEFTSDEFQKAFKVDHIEGKNPKVLLGFKIRTMTTLYEIKQRIMQDFLIPNALFLKEHAGGFQNGIKTFIYGFLKHDHPDHPDIANLTTRFSRITTEAWKKLEKAEKTKWKEEFPQLFYADGVAIPMTFSKERLVADSEGKPKVITNALVVATPKQYGALVRLLLDNAILSKRLNNLIPFAFQKEDQNGYYHLVADHARFMEQHRNIPISNVPWDAPTKKGTKGQPLDQVLYTNKHIQRVAYDPKNEKYHVSTQATKYREVHNWIENMLKEHNFVYSPSIRPMKYNGTNSATKYSTVLADVVSVANASNGSNVWKQRPPLNISYVLTGEAFPPLPKKPTLLSTTQSTASATLDEETIQSAISAAIKTLQDQHQADLNKLKAEMQEEMTAMETQMQEFGKQVVNQTYQALLSDDSPLATKTDHAMIQNDMALITNQLATLIRMVSGGQATVTTTPNGSELQSITSPPRTGKRLKQNRSPEKQGLFGDMFTQDNSVSSATSVSDEGMEGCES